MPGRRSSLRRRAHGRLPALFERDAELAFEFDITLRSDLTNGTTVSNQASLTTTSSVSAFSDDPYVNGVAPPGAPADPTVVTIQAPGALAKANSRATATIGERFTYRITVPATPVARPLYDVRILDDLTVSAADLRFAMTATRRRRRSR